MKVINVTPGIIPIPPNGWGAVEKIIWDYHLELKNLNIQSEILYLNDVKYDDSKVVHVHTANLANESYSRGIPYIFTMHDHHAYLYGKQSRCFEENLKAIENSVISLSPCKFLIDYFGSKKLKYFSHAVNKNTFIYKDRAFNNKLLCIGNNGYASDPSYDRKGFRPAIEAAVKLGMEITVAGPENNKKFFDALPNDLKNYSRLTKLFNLNEEQLVNVYNDHSIFVHMSELEAGHPNLTLLEAMSCGLPIVGTFEEKSYDGMFVVKDRSAESAIEGIVSIKNSYNEYRERALKNSNRNAYSNRVNDLIAVYSDYREKIFANRLLNSYRNTKKLLLKNKILVTFNNGVKVEVNGQNNKKYVVEFIDLNSNSLVYRSEISNNMWSSPLRKFFTNWRVNVFEKLEDNSLKEIHSESLNLTDKKVKINLQTTSLGDLLAYIDPINRFQKKHNCIVDCILPNKDIIKAIQENYSNIKFLFEESANEKYYASYDIGYFLDNWDKGLGVNPRTVKLNYIPSYTLGIDLLEEKPLLSFPQKEKPNKKYVCIATQSTSQCKYWNNPTGWKNLIKHLKEKGYDVWCIDKHSSFGNNIMNYIPEGAIDKTGNLPLEERMSQIKNAEFFIGLGSGLSWLAWAVGVPVVLISGFSKPFAEFSTPYRVINEKVCNGCWNDPNHTFDKANWMWCPRNKNFECTSSITSEMVIEKISPLLSDGNNRKNILLSHLICNPTGEREVRSVKNIQDSLIGFSDINYEILNTKLYSSFPEEHKVFKGFEHWPKNNKKFEEEGLTPGHYGCYKAHMDAIFNFFESKNNYEYLIVAEGDCKIVVNNELFKDRINKAIKILNETDYKMFSFGFNGSNITAGDCVEDNIYRTNKMWLTHLYIISKKHKYYWRHIMSNYGWHTIDWWFNLCFEHEDEKFLFFKGETVATQFDGISYIDKIEKKY
ncbi:MAG: hypothetical protein RLZ10_2313 [Bacteroidota bacterium]|jgi:autotransporter strand-loop-strand O-heptosyltransferase